MFFSASEYKERKGNPDEERGRDEHNEQKRKKWNLSSFFPFLFGPAETPLFFTFTHTYLTCAHAYKYKNRHRYTASISPLHYLFLPFFRLQSCGCLGAHQLEGPIELKTPKKRPGQQQQRQLQYMKENPPRRMLILLSGSPIGCTCQSVFRYICSHPPSHLSLCCVVYFFFFFFLSNHTWELSFRSSQT